ncbi:MAG: hypothetical protein ACREPR_15970 [Brasilonema sp.]
MPISLSSIYAKLRKLDQLDPVTSAIYREKAQDILATPSIALKIRKTIAERLNQANRLLSLKTIEDDDSY